MPDRLLCAHRGNDSENLNWCVYNGSFWSGDTGFSNGAKSTSAPALCIFNGVLYCVHRGKYGNNNLFYCTFDPASQNWSTDIPMEGDNKSGDAPALAVFNGTLYCVHKGGSDNWMWWCKFDPVTRKWSPDYPFTQSNRTNSPPALAVFNSALYCVHRGDDDQNLYWCTFTGSDWTEDTRFPQGNRSGRGPSLYIQNNTLYCVHRGQQSSGSADDQLLYTCANSSGGNWTADGGFPQGNRSADSPAVAIYNGTVFCVHRGITSGGSHSVPNLFYATLTSNGWSADTKFSGGNLSADGPALAVVSFPT